MAKVLKQMNSELNSSTSYMLQFAFDDEGPAPVRLPVTSQMKVPPKLPVVPATPTPTPAQTSKMDVADLRRVPQISESKPSAVELHVVPESVEALTDDNDSWNFDEVMFGDNDLDAEEDASETESDNDESFEEASVSLATVGEISPPQAIPNSLEEADCISSSIGAKTFFTSHFKIQKSSSVQAHDTNKTVARARTHSTKGPF